MPRADKRKRVTPLRVSLKTRTIIREIRELSPRKYSSDDQLVQELVQSFLELLERRAGIPKTDKRPATETRATTSRPSGRYSTGATVTAHAGR